MIDFTNCKVFKKSYSGANGNKICIEYQGDKYMLKFPSKPVKKTELSYANGCISEYVSCHIYEMLGIPVQETLLGTYHTNTKERIVVACKDFTDIGVILQDFGSLKNQVIDSEHQGYGTDLNDILDAIEGQTVIDPNTVLERFWDMFIVDALLGNFDRHNGNWGFLYNQISDDVTLAPVYDCGSCLYPQADKDVITKILSNEEELNSRIYTFPTSAIKINGKKIPYYNYLISTADKGCQKAILKIVPKIDMNKIAYFIDSIDCLEKLQQTFYKTMIRERYEKILEPAYEKLADRQESKLEEPEEMDFF